MTDMKEIKAMKDAELVSFVSEKREGIRSARFNAASKNVRAVRTARREVARALTELSTRTKAANKVDAK